MSVPFHIARCNELRSVLSASLWQISPHPSPAGKTIDLWRIEKLVWHPRPISGYNSGNNFVASGFNGAMRRSELERTVRTDRRNFGVVFVFQMSTGKKSLKILLTEKGDSRETPVAPVTLPSPRSTFRRFSPIRAPEKVSEECWCPHKQIKKRLVR
jgi:hypothetical protein